ncbi:hypothetical protein [Spirosoma validum]|uniref:Uncharacterized protein n=1 Tax=Spirosoma validum TaxID=2771355 RepID=A0A927GDF5_9BACT|nr:hypothetical protein [Spirosoma validum]MBD2753742.1 hypothetical protein [Spirosoma validum]
MNKTRQLLYRTKIAIDSTYHVYWTSLDLSIKGALIAAFVSLLVVYIQKEQQDKKDKDQQTQTEQNKLKYLNFLINDSYKTLDYYNEGVISMVKNYKENPFVVSNLPTYVPYGINSIATKINQEEYYLASVNQFKTGEVAELLQLYSHLNFQYTLAVDHYKKEFPILINLRDTYYDNLTNLTKSVNQFILSESKKKLTGNEKVIFDEINALAGEVNNNLTIQTNQDIWLKDSKVAFVEKLERILDARGMALHQNLLKECKSVKIEHAKYLSHSFNVIGGMEISRRNQQDMLKRIKKTGQPLFDYIESLKRNSKL